MSKTRTSKSDARQRIVETAERLFYAEGVRAVGIDRIIALMCGEPNIREVMAFPKSQQAADLMADAPSTVEQRQLDDLHIALALPQK